MTQIAVLSPHLPPSFLQLLQDLGDVRQFGHYEGDLYAGTQILVATAVDRIDAEQIAGLPDSVQLIANIGVGVDNIDLDAAASRGIQVSNTPVVTEDTADLAMSLLLASCRRVPAAERVLRKGQWLEAGTGMRVHGKTLGIIGFGAIGQAVAKRALGFDMQVCYWGPNRKVALEEQHQVQWCETLADLLAASDIVSLHCPLTEQTRHLINAQTLQQFKPGAVLINTGRGALVHEAALLDALQAGVLAAAGLDVFEFEPEVTPGLLALDNVVLTPHIGSATNECRIDMALRVYSNLQQFLAEGEPLDRVI